MISRSVLFLSIVSSCLNAVAQTAFDADNLYELQMYKPDSFAVNHKITSIKKFKAMVKKDKKIIQEKFFDKAGYISEITEFLDDQEKDTLTFKYVRKSTTKFFVSVEVNSSLIEKSALFATPKKFTPYLERMPNVKRLFISAIYTIENDSLVNIVTSINGIFIDSISLNFLFTQKKIDLSDNTTDYDSTVIKDTSILTHTEILSDSQQVNERQFYLLPAKTLVKKQHIRSIGSTVLYENIQLWQYDSNGRIIEFKELGGVPLQVLQIKRIIYFNNGTKKLLFDRNPANGIVDEIEVYNLNMQPLLMIKNDAIGKEQVKTIYKYSRNNELASEVFMRNSKIQNRYLYEYIHR